MLTPLQGFMFKMNRIVGCYPTLMLIVLSWRDVIQCFIDKLNVNEFYLCNYESRKGEALAEVKKIHIAQLPVPIQDLAKESDKTEHDISYRMPKICYNVKYKEYAEQKPQMKTILQCQIIGLDQQINQAVYLLYDLMECEIKIVE
jgi:hypothetical protein